MMGMQTYAKFPGPFFGGKRHAAPVIWEALGDPMHYVSPFCGSLAVELLRPHPCNRQYYSETANDQDGLLVNALRSIRFSEDATAEAASWYVSEADVMARHLHILQWRQAREVERLMADWQYHDPVIAGFWLYGLSAWIGSGWCSGHGPWIVGADGRITRRVSSAVPGVTRKLPHLGDNGRGVHHAGLRAPGVMEDAAFHPMTMPELRRWFQFLSARFRHMRLVNGDWSRVVTDGAMKTLSVRHKGGHVAVFLDPPYHPEHRATGLYTADGDATLVEDVRTWCLAHGDDPTLRIVLAGFAGEGHEVLESHGWRCLAWYTPQYLTGGYGMQSEAGTQQDRERLWLSPHCLRPERTPRQIDMFPPPVED